MKIKFELSEKLAGMQIKIDNKTEHWENLTRQQQIWILNALAGHHELFSRFLKDE